jgi:drug/metabolite transporter (DMT)-like permease
VIVSGRWGELTSLDGSQWAWALLTGVLLAGYVATWYAALARAQAIDVTAVLVLAAVVTAILDRTVEGVPLDLVGLALITLGSAAAAALALRSVRRPSTA